MQFESARGTRDSSYDFHPDRKMPSLGTMPFRQDSLESMISFLGKLLRLTRPYAFRLSLGILAGLLCGIVEPMLMLIVKLAIEAVFPASGAPSLLDQYAVLRKAVAWAGGLIGPVSAPSGATTT